MYLGALAYGWYAMKNQDPGIKLLTEGHTMNI